MNARMYYARTKNDCSDGDHDKIKWQKLEDHLRETAVIASGFFSRSPLKRWAYTAGLWHDIGKYSDVFQKRLTDNRIRAVHSTAGAKAASEVFAGTDGQHSRTGQIFGYVISGHHAGLPDGKSADDSCLATRLKNEPPIPPACPEGLLHDHGLSIRDIEPILSNRSSPKDCAFGLSFFIRMLFSCVVDADRLNSEAFAELDKALLRIEQRSLNDLNAKLSVKLEKLSHKEPSLEINRHRTAILKQCLAAAEMDTGLFSLTVPTGGGKTLSSLAFALKHALKHSLKRIIYVIPYTSIIEQNARVFRECLGDDAVIEHHCNYEPPDDREEVSPHSLAMENWDAPLIVTTNVQFFESLFSHKPSRCRKLHNIADSVVILDEAQMLSPGLLYPCLAAIRELTSRYNTSIVLCTATQPAFGKDDGLKNGLDNVREIIADPVGLYRELKRIDIEFIGRQKHEDLASMIDQHDQVLCIVNTRARARHLFDLCEDGDSAYHLSALMCPAHRTQVLETIKKRLADGLPCRVISTQLIEAGVDVDFPAVYRELAGADSIAQAAGRCNREGRLNRGKVYVFETPDGAPKMFRQQTQATRSVVRSRGDDVLSLESIREYFQELYWVKGEDALDKDRILDSLTPGLEHVNFPFREIGETFRLIDQATTPVLIPFDDDCKKLADVLKNGKPSRNQFRKMQKYTVSLYPHEFTALCDAGAVEKVNDFIAVLTNPDLYKDTVGLAMDNPYYRNPETTIT